MSDEAKEIERLRGEIETCLQNLVRQKAMDRQDAGFLLNQSDSLAALARRLLLERDETVKMRFDRVERIASLERERDAAICRADQISDLMQTIETLRWELQEAKREHLCDCH